MSITWAVWSAKNKSKGAFPFYACCSWLVSFPGPSLFLSEDTVGNQPVQVLQSLSASSPEPLSGITPALRNIWPHLQLASHTFLSFPMPLGPAPLLLLQGNMASCIRHTVFLSQSIQWSHCRSHDETQHDGSIYGKRLQSLWSYNIILRWFSSANKNRTAKCQPSIRPRSCTLQVAPSTRIKDSRCRCPPLGYQCI